MTEEESERYQLALRTQLAERRALWEILQELIGRYAQTFDKPEDALGNMAERVTGRLQRKEADAKNRGLELPLATVQSAVDRFFSELSSRQAADEL